MNEPRARLRRKLTENGASRSFVVDQERIRAAVREILLAVGEDPDREGLLETPDRVARMYAEMFSGLHRDPRELLQKTFTQKYDEMVLVKDIELRQSCCEHHLLPFIGKAHIAYLPNGKIVGLSKLARVVEVLARRPQVQERMTEEMADLLMEELDARGVGVILEATHTCMTIRGVRKPGQRLHHQRHARHLPRQPGHAQRADGPDLRVAVTPCSPLLSAPRLRHDRLLCCCLSPRARSIRASTAPTS